MTKKEMKSKEKELDRALDGAKDFYEAYELWEKWHMENDKERFLEAKATVERDFCF